MISYQFADGFESSDSYNKRMFFERVKGKLKENVDRISTIYNIYINPHLVSSKSRVIINIFVSRVDTTLMAFL